MKNNHQLEKFMMTANEKRKLLTEIQKEKLHLAAQMLKATAKLYDESKPNLLPLWGGGIITHGQPQNKAFTIGISKKAANADKNERTKDHLCRVTETAKVILSRLQKENLSVEQIEDILLDRSIYMIVTRSENSNDLKKAKDSSNEDDWEALYKKAGVEYSIYKK